MSDFATGPVTGHKALKRRWSTPSPAGVEKTITALHGSYRGYNQGCRCDECTEGKRRYNADLKARLAAVPEVVITCSRCERASLPFDSFDEAVEDLTRLGWNVTPPESEFCDLCPGCESDLDARSLHR